MTSTFALRRHADLRELRLVAVDQDHPRAGAVRIAAERLLERIVDDLPALARDARPDPLVDRLGSSLLGRRLLHWAQLANDVLGRARE